MKLRAEYRESAGYYRIFDEETGKFVTNSPIGVDPERRAAEWKVERDKAQFWMNYHTALHEAIKECNIRDGIQPKLKSEPKEKT